MKIPVDSSVAAGSLADCTVVILDHPNVQYVVQGISSQLKAMGLEVSVLPATDTPLSIPDCDALLTCSSFSCTAQVMDSLPRLKGIAALATGTESIDIKAATQRGLPVVHPQPPENVVSIAEGTIMLILASLSRLHESEGRFLKWQRPDVPYARTLSGKTLGIIGFGKIARAVAERLSSWDVRILTYSPHAPEAMLPANVRKVALDELITECDVISVHAAVDASNHALIDERVLERLKVDAVLVNTARGALINEQALANSMAKGKPAYVALDCFEKEPLPQNSPIHGIANGIFTPHMVGHTKEVQESLIAQGVANVLAILHRVAPQFVRNPEVLERCKAAS